MNKHKIKKYAKIYLIVSAITTLVAFITGVIVMVRQLMLIKKIEKACSVYIENNDFSLENFEDSFYINDEDFDQSLKF
ncbi:MAG: hypothetical protein RSB96_00920 [Oscillospiraceae bacterium]